MNFKLFFRSALILATLWIVTPGSAFCELQALKDDELSKVDAKAGSLFDTKVNEGDSEAGIQAGFSDRPNDLDRLESANACSGALNCNPAQNDFFSPGQQVPMRYTAPMPHCSSGGCR